MLYVQHVLSNNNYILNLEISALAIKAISGHSYPGSKEVQLLALA